MFQLILGIQRNEELSSLRKERTQAYPCGIFMLEKYLPFLCLFVFTLLKKVHTIFKRLNTSKIHLEISSIVAFNTIRGRD